MCLLTAGTCVLPYNYGVKYLSPNPKQLFKLKCVACSAFCKANILKVELSMIKIGELLRKLWSLRSWFLILAPEALTPRGIEGAMKRDVSKHWCTLQWCASRGWFIAHENWTLWRQHKIKSQLIFTYTWCEETAIKEFQIQCIDWEQILNVPNPGNYID